MSSYNIAFPNLNLFFNINPIAFSLGKVNVYWYGILITFAIVLGLILARRRDGKYGIRYENIEDFVIWAIPISVIFARLYYVIFSWNSYKDDFSSVFKIWNGGLAIYGGIIGAVLTAIIYCKVKKIKLLDVLDYAVPFLALGQAIGRWGNFFNQEAYGSATTLEFLNKIIPFDFIVEGMNIDGIYYHPTFLYESLWCLLGFIILLFVRRMKYTQIGQITGFYLIWYGIGRFFIEILRTDSLMFGNIKAAQVISILMILLGFLIIFIKARKFSLTDRYNSLEG